MQEQRQHRFLSYILSKFNNFLSKEDKLPKHTYLYDYDKMIQEIKPGDLLLVESHTRLGNIIRLISESTWTHSALYIGKAEDIKDPNLRSILSKHTTQPSDHLVIESILGKGTIVSSVSSYKNYHIRILRPSMILPEDIDNVIAFAIHDIGEKYSIRHLFDLARFIFPWSIFPRRWRSSLFQHNMLQPTEDICSSMIADAFQSINYPILPVIQKEGEVYAFIHRNPRLYTPSDFDLSPYFNVIKYPILPLKPGMSYRDLPWKKQFISDDLEIVKLNQ